MFFFDSTELTEYKRSQNETTNAANAEECLRIEYLIVDRIYDLPDPFAEETFARQEKGRTGGLGSLYVIVNREIAPTRDAAECVALNCGPIAMGRTPGIE